MSDEFGRALVQLTNSVHLLALEAGRPVAAGTFIHHDGIAFFGGGFTLHEHRSRGLQQALLIERLHRAKELGCSLACVSADVANTSARNIQRAGFSVAYTEVGVSRR